MDILIRFLLGKGFVNFNNLLINKEECYIFDKLKRNKLIFDLNNDLEIEIKNLILEWLDSKEKTYHNFLEKINIFLKNNINIEKKDFFKKIRKIFTKKEEGISISLLINEFSYDLIKSKIFF